MWIILIIILLVLLFMYIHSKKLVLPNLVLITGAVKTGKSLLSVRLSIKQYRKQLTKYYIKKCFNAIYNCFHSVKREVEKPLLYSNIPLRFPHVKLTLDLLLRNERFAYGSVILIDEASLLADGMSFKDDDVNETLQLFNKLIGHETHGGYIFYDTQSIKDCHFAIKRCVSRFIYIYASQKIPFFVKMQVREMIFSSENESSNTFDKDIEKSMLNLYVPKSYFKMYDCYAYSILTDDLPVNDKIVTLSKKSSLKSDDILQIRKFKNLYGGRKEKDK